MWSRSSEPPVPLSFVNIRNYKVGIDVRDFPELEQVPLPKTFAGEEFYLAPQTYDLSWRNWEVLMAAVDGTVYKIALHHESHDKSAAKEQAYIALQYCRHVFGKPTEEKHGFSIWDGIFIWDIPGGNVVFQTRKYKDKYTLNLFFTSSAVRSFTPVERC